MKIGSEKARERSNATKGLTAKLGRPLVSPRAGASNPSVSPSPGKKASRPDQASVSREAREGNAGDGRISNLIDSLQDAFHIGTKRAEKKDRDASIAVFDDFSDADKEGVSTHGEQVEGVIQQEGGFSDEDIQRYQINSGGSKDELADRLADNDDDALNDYVEDRYTSMLDNTSDGLEEILNDDDSQIRTVNQSQSVAEGRIVRDLWDEAKAKPEFRADLARHLGLGDNASDRDLAQALADGVGDVVNHSDDIAESKERFDRVSARASAAGITHVVTSGNLGSFANEMERLGVETDKEFYDSAFLNRHTLVVGAVNDNGSTPTSANFNSPSANADVSAPGVNVDITTQDGQQGTNSGTSFAAPAVAALVARMKAENPDLTSREIELILRRTADEVNGPYSEVGSGTINPEAALAAAA